MENAGKIPQLYRAVANRTNNAQSAVLVGLGLVVLLSSLAGLNPIIGVASALGLLLIVIVSPRQILIVYGLAFVLPLVGGLARGAVIPFLRVGQALLVVGFILFVLARPGRLGKSRLTTIDLAFVLYFLTEAVFPVLALLYGGGRIEWSSTDNVYGVSPLQTMLGPLQYYLLYRIVVASISSEKQIKVILKFCFISSMIVAVIGILQSLRIAPVKAFLDAYYPPVLLRSVQDIHQRITSTLESYLGLAAYLCFIILAALVCYAFQKRLGISRLLLVATILLDGIALILTGTLAGWIGLAIGVAVVFLLIGRLPKAVLFLPIALTLALLLFQPFISARLNDQLGDGAAQGLLPQSFAFRIVLWQDIFLPAIGQHLFFGAGPAPAATALWSTEESQYFHLLLRGGLFHFFSYLLLIGIAIATCWRQYRSKSEEASRVVAIATLSILVALSVMNVSGVYFTYVGGTQILWTFLAIVVACEQLKVMDTTVVRQFVTHKRRTGDIASHTLPDIALTTGTNESLGTHIVGDENTTRFYDGLLISTNSEMNRKDEQRFSWLRRILDWHFVKDSVVVGVGSTIARVLGLLFATLLAHFLTPDAYGFYRYSITLAGIITIVSTASPVGMARFLAANRDDQQARDRYFSNGLFGIALIMIASLLISIPILGLAHVLNLGTITFMVGVTGYYGYLALARGLGSAWKMSLTFALSNAALIVALFVVLGFFRLHTTTAALTIYGLTDLAPIFVLELIRPMALRFRLSLISKAVLLDMARFAMPIVLATGTYTIWSGIDVLLVQSFVPHEAGSYAIAKTLAGAFLFVPAAITLVLMPRVAALESDRSKRYSKGALAAVFLISMLGLAIVYLWGHRLISLAFGQGYSGAYSPLLVLSVGMSIYAVYAIVEAFVIGRGRPSLSVPSLLVALVSTGVTGFWLTSRLGTLGASLSFTIGATLGTVILLFNTWRFLRKEQPLSRAETIAYSTPPLPLIVLKVAEEKPAEPVLEHPDAPHSEEI